MIESLFYLESDLEKWAGFSGDRNPIHFDKKLVARNGLNNLVVHGMLAMLDMKIAFNMKKCISIDDCLNLNFNLKKPVLIEEPISLSFSDGNDKIYIRDKLNNTLYSCRATQDPIFDTDFRKNVDITEINNEMLKGKLSDFKKHYKSARYDWIFLDALSFFIYIMQNKNDSLAKETERFMEKNNILTGTDFIVYQVSHISKIDRKLINREGFNFGPLSYQTYGKDIYSCGDKVFGSVVVDVFEDSKKILSTELGLIVVPEK